MMPRDGCNPFSFCACLVGWFHCCSGSLLFIIVVHHCCPSLLSFSDWSFDCVFLCHVISFIFSFQKGVGLLCCCLISLLCQSSFFVGLLFNFLKTTNFSIFPDLFSISFLVFPCTYSARGFVMSMAMALEIPRYLAL